METAQRRTIVHSAHNLYFTEKARNLHRAAGRQHSKGVYLSSTNRYRRDSSSVRTDTQHSHPRDRKPSVHKRSQRWRWTFLLLLLLLVVMLVMCVTRRERKGGGEEEGGD